MTTDQNKSIVTRFNKEVIAGKSVDSLLEILAEDFINHSAPPGISPRPDGMITFLQNVLWKALSDIDVEIHDQIAEGDKVVTRKTIHGTQVGEFLGLPASNKRIGIQITDIVRLRNGKYIEHWRSWDPMQIAAQIKG